MGQFVAVRALNRSAKIRVTDRNGNIATLSTTTDTILDLDLGSNRVALNHHRAIGQWVVTAVNATQGASGSKSALPANS